MSEALFSRINPIVSLSRRARHVADDNDEAGAEQETAFLCDAVQSVGRFADEKQFSMRFDQCMAKYDEQAAAAGHDDSAATAEDTSGGGGGVTEHDYYTLAFELTDRAPTGSPVRNSRDVTTLLREHIKAWIVTRPGTRITKRHASRLIRDIFIVYDGGVYKATLQLRPLPAPPVVDSASRKRRRVEPDTVTDNEERCRKQARVHHGDKVPAKQYADFYASQWDLFDVAEQK